MKKKGQTDNSSERDVVDVSSHSQLYQTQSLFLPNCHQLACSRKTSLTLMSYTICLPSNIEPEEDGAPICKVSMSINDTKDKCSHEAFSESAVSLHSPFICAVVIAVTSPGAVSSSKISELASSLRVQQRLLKHKNGSLWTGIHHNGWINWPHMSNLSNSDVDCTCCVILIWSHLSSF